MEESTNIRDTYEQLSLIRAHVSLMQTFATHLKEADMYIMTLQVDRTLTRLERLIRAQLPLDQVKIMSERNETRVQQQNSKHTKPKTLRQTQRRGQKAKTDGAIK